MKRFSSLLLITIICLSVAGCGQSEAVKNFNKKVEVLGTVTIDSEVAIKEAEEAYEKLSVEEKKEIDRSTLDQAKIKYQNLVNERDAKTVIKLIDDIGNITIESKSNIENARKNYDALNDDAKQKVTNYSKLQDAETQLKTICETEIARLKSLCDYEYDDMTDISWYKTKQQSISRKFVLPYFGISDDTAFLRVLFYYSDRTNIGFDNVIVMSDGQKYTRTFNALKEKNINVVTGQEWADILAEDSDIAMLKAIANSTETKVRYTGTFQDEFVVSEEDKQAIKELLSLYYLMQ